jgi:hypothetical protein
MSAVIKEEVLDEVPVVAVDFNGKQNLFLGVAL